MPRVQPPFIKLKKAHNIIFSPTEDRVATLGGRDVTMLKLPAATPLFSVHPIADPIYIDFSPDGGRLVVKNSSGRTVVLDALTGATLTDFRNQKEGQGCAALFSTCGRYVVSGSWDGSLRVRDSATGQIVFSHVYGECLLNLVSTPRDRRLFAFSVSRRGLLSDSKPTPPEVVALHSWPIRDSSRRELPPRWSFTSDLKISPSGNFLAVIHGAPPESFEIYDIENSRTIARRDVSFGGTGCFVDWSHDESMVVINGDHRCLVLELPSLSVKQEFPFSYPCNLCFSPSSRWLGIGSSGTGAIIPMANFDAFPQFKKMP